MYMKRKNRESEYVFSYEARGRVKFGIDLAASLANGKFFRCRVQGFENFDLAKNYATKMIEKIDIAKTNIKVADDLINKKKKTKKQHENTLEGVFEQIQVYMEKTKCVEPETIAQYISTFRNHLSKYSKLIFSEISQDVADEIYENYRSEMLFRVIIKYANILKIKYPVVFRRVEKVNPTGKRRYEGKSLFEIMGR